jgi:RNA ligase
MYYDFPVIRNISDVLPAIEGSDEFSIINKGEYTTINYHLMSNTTFPPVYNDLGEYNVNAAIRRECRGIIFCSKTGKILRRPFQKFFNYGEKEETKNIILTKDNHGIFTKLDGSLLSPFIINDSVIFGTKAGETDVSNMALDFLSKNSNYYEHARSCIEQGLTPIYEFCSRKQKIVLDYPEDRIVLLAIRNMVTGEYLPHDWVSLDAYDHNIEVVESHNPTNDVVEFINKTSILKGIEGFVVSFHNGHKFKIKTDEYVAIHKAKEAILWDRNIVQLILDNNLDDIKPHLLSDDLDKLNKFEDAIVKFIKQIKINVVRIAYECSHSMSRKEFALNIAPNLVSLTRTCVYSIWDSPTIFEAGKFVDSMIRKNLTSNKNYDELCNIWFNNERYN